MGATPVKGETGKLKYFDVPCSRNSRPTMMRKILSTRGDHVARKLSIAGIIISPMDVLGLAKLPSNSAVITQDNISIISLAERKAFTAKIITIGREAALVRWSSS